MTRYEQGFMNKCAEYGIDGRSVLLKLAQDANAGAQPGLWTRAKDKVVSGYNQAKDKVVSGYNQAAAWSKDNPAGAGAIGGAGAGALAMLLHEAIRRRKGPDDRKDYLKQILLGLALGGAAGAAGGHWGPGAYSAAKPYFRNLGNAVANTGRALANKPQKPLK